MAHGLFITDKVTVGVVASVCQCPSAPNPLTVSLAQVVGTALPYDKHSLVEGSWTRARHPKDKRQWTVELLEIGAHMACLIFGPFLQTLFIMYLQILSWCDKETCLKTVTNFAILFSADNGRKITNFTLNNYSLSFLRFSLELFVELMSFCNHSIRTCIIHHLTDFLVCWSYHWDNLQSLLKHVRLA